MPPILRFPDPTDTGPEGVLAVGGDLHPDSLLLAYRHGIFPWPILDPEARAGSGEHILAWFCPPERGILDFADLRLPRSLRRFLAKKPYRYSFDRAFERVIDGCQAAYRPGQPGTWITPGLRDAYVEFHRLGHVHSVEAWDTATGELAGGLYGVYLDGLFAGESMFHLQPNASKAALLHLVDHLRAHGADWIDIQMVTPHMTALGAKAISRDEFLSRLKRTHARHRRSPSRPSPFQAHFLE